MSEPQHPHPQDTGTDTGHPAPAATRAAVVQPAVQTGLDSLMAVGARLTQLRESKNWSIDDVSARLKVSSAKLRALEAGDISQLPDTTFALGVVRSYAKMLGADPAPFTQALRREKGVPAPDLSMPASSGRDLPRGGSCWPMLPGLQYGCPPKRRRDASEQRCRRSMPMAISRAVRRVLRRLRIAVSDRKHAARRFP